MRHGTGAGQKQGGGHVSRLREAASIPADPFRLRKAALQSRAGDVTMDLLPWT